VNRGWVPRGWRDKNTSYKQNVDEASELKEAVTKTNEKSSWWKFWSKESKYPPEVIYIPFLI
jgi:surfeit locus 1 family protein